MQVIQNRMIRIIGLKKETAYSKYGILNVSDFIELSRLEQVKRILKTQTHSLPISLGSNQRSHFSFNLKIPIARTEKFNQSAVIKNLRFMRDSASRIKVLSDIKSVPKISTTALKKCPTCPMVSKRLDLHRCKAVK